MALLVYESNILTMTSIFGICLKVSAPGLTSQGSTDNMEMKVSCLCNYRTGLDYIRKTPPKPRNWKRTHHFSPVIFQPQILNHSLDFVRPDSESLAGLIHMAINAAISS